ncbi:50S ribosomal protein L3 [Candidatus Acetothermia bacterium]|nr:50S ribosomal protein L3 [Candidatus Acetothermia bacterium]MBI3460362.1 50S ribosomal protein L3 [Candidatus Acetothermia bacterium]
MALGILGQKAGMMTWFDPKGRAIAATVILAEPSVVTQIKTTETDGYNAIQLGHGKIKEKNITKPEKGHLNKAGAAPKRTLCEFSIENPSEYKPGQELSVSIFQEGELVHVSATSKGKGTMGVMRRHGFRGGDASHGSSKWHRRPGSIGNIRATGKTFKGWRMAGRMGNERATVQNLQVLKIIPEKNLLVIKGAVPGHNRAVIEIRKAG